MKLFLNKEIENNIRKIFRIIIYTKKVYLEKRLEGSVYIWPVGISMKIFNEMKTLISVPKYIKIYYLANFINIIYSISYYFYFLLKFLFLPELIYFSKIKNYL